MPPPVPINTTGSFKRLALSYQTKNFENPIQPNETEQKKKIYFTTTKQQQPFFYFDKYLQNYSFCFLTPKIKLNRKGKKIPSYKRKKLSSFSPIIIARSNTNQPTYIIFVVRKSLLSALFLFFYKKREFNRVQFPQFPQFLDIDFYIFYSVTLF